MRNIKGKLDLESLHNILEKKWKEDQASYRQKRKGIKQREDGIALKAIDLRQTEKKSKRNKSSRKLEQILPTIDSELYIDADWQEIKSLNEIIEKLYRK